MKHLLFLLSLAILMAQSSCNSCTSEDDSDPKYDVMTRYGAWEARADETRAKVQKIEDRFNTFLHYEFDSLDHHIFDSEYPYWDKIDVYLNEKGLQKAKLFAMPSESLATEEFYFDEGNLIYAQKEEKGMKNVHPDSALHGNQFFFTRGVLVLALDPEGKRRDIEDDTVKIESVDLMHEAKQIREIIAQKQIKL